MFLDLDDFKEINDSYGHDAGDAVLKEVATRLVETLRDCDVVARYAGDEFLVLLDDYLTGHESAGASVALEVVEALSEPFIYGEHHIIPSASIGIVFFPNEGDRYEDLISKADKAMYQAKRSSGLQFCFANVERQPAISSVC